ncbi:hypothetical protein K3495_g6128 [Podosphaera aphanis]|nr:hypothetical protein K3495_g6128 [Podosphaera aphanis]
MSQMMLLTRNLTQFLTQNTTRAIPTMILLSPAGKLLSSSSPLPAARLRTQATLAYSLWTLYRPAVASITAALPHPVPSPDVETILPSTSKTKHDLSTLTIQLSQAVLVIRALSCGLLFVAIGVSNVAPSASLSAGSAKSSPSTSVREDGGGPKPSNDATSTSNTESPTACITETKLLSEEVAKWLDEQLAGFNLYTGEA